MDKPTENFWQIRLADVKTALEANNFEAFLAEKKEDVHKIVLEDLIPQLKPKIVPDLEEAMHRVKNYVAPANSMRLDKKTPCVKTSYCEECKSPDRICNSWTITEKSFPKGRVKIILINEDLGL